MGQKAHETIRGKHAKILIARKVPCKAYFFNNALVAWVMVRVPRHTEENVIPTAIARHLIKYFNTTKTEALNVSPSPSPIIRL